MKRIIPFVAAVLVALSSQAQTIHVNLENGKTVKYYASDVTDITFSDRIEIPSEEDPEHFRAVDFDLPSKLLWASHNIGAKNPEDAGVYFAWGETKPKHEYGWGTYKWGTQWALTKYTSADGKTTLDPADDAATYNWGDGWHMPTKADFEELFKYTTVRKYYKKDQNGNDTDELLGLQFVKKNNSGISIILPFTGYIINHSVTVPESTADYWTPTLDENNTQKAFLFWFMTAEQGAAVDHKMESDSRPNGQVIRPVKVKVTE